MPFLQLTTGLPPAGGVACSLARYYYPFLQEKCLKERDQKQVVEREIKAWREDKKRRDQEYSDRAQKRKDWHMDWRKGWHRDQERRVNPMNSLEIATQYLVVNEVTIHISKDSKGWNAQYCTSEECNQVKSETLREAVGEAIRVIEKNLTLAFRDEPNAPTFLRWFRNAIAREVFILSNPDGWVNVSVDF
jgi:hypothetical protein